MNSLFESDYKDPTATEIVDEAIKMLDELKTAGIRKLVNYRLFIKIMEQEALYADKAEVAGRLSNAITGIPSDISDADLTRLAKCLVDLHNELYTALYEDLKDKSMANQAIKYMLTK